MGSSAKKKREKKKDFQVRLSDARLSTAKTDSPAETEIKGWQDQAQSRQLYRYQLSSQK
jgi:hypothetical protein